MSAVEKAQPDEPGDRHRCEHEQPDRLEEQLGERSEIWSGDPEQAVLVGVLVADDVRVGKRERVPERPEVEEQGRQHAHERAARVGAEAGQPGFSEDRVDADDRTHEGDRELGGGGQAGEQPGEADVEEPGRCAPFGPEHGEGREGQRRRERVREQHRRERQHHRRQPERHGGGGPVARLQPPGDAGDEQEQDERGEDRSEQLQVPDLRPGFPDRIGAARRLQQQVGGKDREREARRLRGVVVAVDQREIAGSVLGHPALADLEPRLVDVGRAVRQRADERVVRALVPAEVLHRDHVDESDRGDRQEPCVEADPGERRGGARVHRVEPTSGSGAANRTLAERLDAVLRALAREGTAARGSRHRRRGLAVSHSASSRVRLRRTRARRPNSLLRVFPSTRRRTCRLGVRCSERQCHVGRGQVLQPERSNQRRWHGRPGLLDEAQERDPSRRVGSHSPSGRNRPTESASSGARRSRRRLRMTCLGRGRRHGRDRSSGSRQVLPSRRWGPRS